MAQARWIDPTESGGSTAEGHRAAAAARARWIDPAESGGSTADARIADVLGAYRGYGARWQLLDAGVPDHVLDRRVARDRLFIVRDGVYAAMRPQRTRWERVATSVLACGPGALASCWTAAETAGAIRPAGGIVHVLSPGDFAHRQAGVRDHRINRLDPEDVASFDDIPCTSAPLFLLDIAASAGRRYLERAVDRTIVEGLCDEAALHDVLVRHPRRPGARALRRLLAVHAPGTTDTRSSPEEAFHAFVVAHGLPLPQFNVPRVLPSGRRIVHDAIWPEHGVVVELDARSTHDTPLRFEEDRERDLEVTLLGLRTVRITRRRLRETPMELAAQFHALLERGGSTAL